MNIIAITACPTGVAHTFMAKRALEDAAKKRGHEIKVETQGATGIENELTPTDVKNADILILAVEVGIAKSERFKDIKKVEVKIGTVIKSAESLIRKIEEKLENKE
ncbi:PTS fructose transporter subunit IIB [Alkalibacterium sp. 20]|uniref:PTS fructose transporter subunit IIB n=1 Tax=Alkalibacterium sp. 20 TaxID=1798803 RepID=UPI0009002219|nr:PTS fructose transporter subunit IIB [Alkalibacterium sp. 20]OJF90662.1 PTS fructose transporter subunit IIB [Alkalibacterium sp. 20]